MTFSFPPPCLSCKFPLPSKLPFPPFPVPMKALISINPTSCSSSNPQFPQTPNLRTLQRCRPSSSSARSSASSLGTSNPTRAPTRSALSSISQPSSAPTVLENWTCVYSRANPGEMYEALEQTDRVMQGALLDDVHWSMTRTPTRTNNLSRRKEPWYVDVLVCHHWYIGS